jgi:hypothetical protein
VTPTPAGSLRSSRASRRDWALVAAVLALMGAVSVVWLGLDRAPPVWDHANHLERAVVCAHDLAAGDVGAVVAGRSSFYPPVVPCLGGVVYLLWPSDVVFGQVVMLGFLGLGMAMTYVLGRAVAGGAGGVVAAVLFATAPFLVLTLLRFQLDVPLAAMVATALVALRQTDGFRRRGWSMACGLVLGVGLLTKLPFVVYVAPALALVAVRGRSRRALAHGVLALVVAGLVAAPFYGLRLLTMLGEVQARSFRQAAEAGHPEPFTLAALAFYPLTFAGQFGVLGAGLTLIGLVVAVWRRHGFVLAALAPLALFFLIQNKNLRYTLPLLPAAAVVAGLGFAALPALARRPLAVLVAAFAAVQVVGAAFPVWPALRQPLLEAGFTMDAAPDRAEWRQREVLARIVDDAASARAAGARVPAAPTVSVVPNHPKFSVSNFRYYAVRDGLPLTFMRAWDDPFGVAYMIVKSGDVGPPWTAERIERVRARLAADRSLAGVYPVIAEFALPDGSKAEVRVRRIPANLEITPERLAREVEAAVRTRLGDVTRDVEGLRVRLAWDREILEGRLRRIEISAAAATVGDFAKPGSPHLRLRGLRVVVDDVLVNPLSASLDRRLDLLDAAALTVADATVAAGDFRAFVGGFKAFRGGRIELEDGAFLVSLDRRGPDLSGRIRLTASSERPFALIAERLSLGGVPLPGPVVAWAVRSYDPSIRLARRLPLQVRIGPVTVTPERIRLGGGQAAGAGN